MILTVYIPMFFVTLCFVASKAFQNLCIIHNNRKTVLLMGYVIALFEVAGVGLVSIQANKSLVDAFWLVIPMGTAGGIGCLLSMMLHKRMPKSK